MKKLITSLVSLGVVGALSGCASSEPKVLCNVGRSAPFAMQYALKPGADPSCQAVSDLLNSGGVDAKGNPLGLNVMGLEGYVSDKNLSLNTVAIRPGEYASAPVPGAGSTDPNPNALGTFTAFNPDANSLCTVPTFTSATQDPSKYDFANLQAFNDPAHAGTQIQVDVTYHPTAAAPSCAFTALGTWPAITCTTDADCDPVGNQHPTTSPTNIYGSGIAADYPTKCSVGGPDGSQHYCILDTTKGSFPYLGTGNYGPP